jgi:rhomboid family GlyGly-CTERM serine protease
MEVALSSLSSFTRAVAGSPGSVVLAAALVLLNLPLLGGRVNTSLIFLPEAVRMGEWWRVLSHPFVHLTWYHFLLDVGAFLLLYGGLGEHSPLKRIGYVAACGMGSLVVSTLASPVVHAQGLCGLSGTAHGLMAISALDSIVRASHNGKWSRTGVITLGLVVAKSVVEVLQGHVFFESLHFGLMGLPVPESHAGGVLSGMIACLAFGTRRSERNRAAPPR